MSNQTVSLWPRNFGNKPTVPPSPVHILRQQALQLGQGTRNFVLGKVTSRLLDDKTFAHTFALTAPVLGLEQSVLTVVHGLDLYPARISLDPLLAPAGNPTHGAREAASEE